MTHPYARTLMHASLLAVLVACGGGNKGTTATRPARQDDSMVQGKELQDHPEENIEQMLAGKVSGVVVSRAGDGTLILRIRGSSGYNAEPMYVVDGVQVYSLAGINPRDIDSIKVLKDAVDTSMYGSRGANGVILIKTKKPTR